MGADVDPETQQIIKKGKLADKIGAQSRDGNIALEVKRPNLEEWTFEQMKAILLEKAAAGDESETKKPDMHFLNVP